MKTSTIRCDIPTCLDGLTEKGEGDGFQDWGAVHGIAGAQGQTPIYLCPMHLKQVAEFMDTLRGAD